MILIKDRQTLNRHKIALLSRPGKYDTYKESTLLVWPKMEPKPRWEI